MSRCITDFRLASSQRWFPESIRFVAQHGSRLLDLDTWHSGSSRFATDCKSLFDLISRTAPPSCQEFRALLQARLIKEHLATGIAVRWVPSSAQVADCLTKIMDASTLRELMHIGRYQLKDEDEILRSRSGRKARLRWFCSHEQSQGSTSD